MYTTKDYSQTGHFSDYIYPLPFFPVSGTLIKKKQEKENEKKNLVLKKLVKNGLS